MSLHAEMKRSFSFLHKFTVTFLGLMIVWGLALPYLPEAELGFPTYVISIIWGLFVIFFMAWFTRQLCRISYLSGRMDEMEDQYRQTHLWTHEG